jgi:hypothetical protein
MMCAKCQDITNPVRSKIRTLLYFVLQYFDHARNGERWAFRTTTYPPQQCSSPAVYVIVPYVDTPSMVLTLIV